MLVNGVVTTTASQLAGDHAAHVDQRSVCENGAGNGTIFAVRVLINGVVTTMASWREGDTSALVDQRSVYENGAGNGTIFAVRVLVNGVVTMTASQWAGDHAALVGQRSDSHQKDVSFMVLCGIAFWGVLLRFFYMNIG